MIVVPITIKKKTTPNPPPQAKVERVNGRPVEREKAEPKPYDAARLTEKGSRYTEKPTIEQ